MKANVLEINTLVVGVLDALPVRFSDLLSITLANEKLEVEVDVSKMTEALSCLISDVCRDSAATKPIVTINTSFLAIGNAGEATTNMGCVLLSLSFQPRLSRRIRRQSLRFVARIAKCSSGSIHVSNKDSSWNRVNIYLPLRRSRSTTVSHVMSSSIPAKQTAERQMLRSSAA
jgi:hypothetical protein